MTKKSKFLKSAKLAIAGVVLTTGLSACGMMGDKHNCMSKGDKAKSEKANCSGTVKNEKAGCASKDGKSGCASSVKEDKANCSSSAKEGKASCSSSKKK